MPLIPRLKIFSCGAAGLQMSGGQGRIAKPKMLGIFANADAVRDTVARAKNRHWQEQNFSAIFDFLS
jgi:hypothetical protein